MKRVLTAAAAMALMGALGACAKTDPAPGGGAAGTEPDTGSVRLNLSNSMTVGETMAFIVIQNLFDSSQSYLIDCGEKSHKLDGATFCDELIVLPPGVYEIIVQSADPNCRAEHPFYKVIVKAGVTVELPINLICGEANGGLDVLVRKTEPPVFEDINFDIDGVEANKFVCRYGEQVTATAWVTDSDTECADLQAYWYSNGVPATFVSPFPAPFGSAPAVGVDPETGACLFAIRIDPFGPLASYDIKVVVTDGKYSSSLTFPVHIVDCGNLPDGGVDP